MLWDLLKGFAGGCLFVAAFNYWRIDKIGYPSPMPPYRMFMWGGIFGLLAMGIILFLLILRDPALAWRYIPRMVLIVASIASGAAACHYFMVKNSY